MLVYNNNDWLLLHNDNGLAANDGLLLHHYDWLAANNRLLLYDDDWLRVLVILVVLVVVMCRGWHGKGKGYDEGS